MKCRIHHIYAPKDKPRVYVGDVSIARSEDLQMSGLMSLQMNADDGTKMLVNDSIGGSAMFGKGISITSPKPLILLHVEAFIAAFTYRLKQERNDRNEYVIALSIIGSACPEYFSQRQDELFRLVVVEDGEVSDICVLKGGRYRVYPKGAYVDWLNDERNRRLLGTEPKVDIVVRKDQWSFERWNSSKKHIFAYLSDTTPTAIKDRFDLEFTEEDIESSMYSIQEIQASILSGNTRINPKNVVMVGDEMSEIWRMRSEFDNAVDQYLMKKAQ